jgi:predicted PurR-regulated permease PerM
MIGPGFGLHGSGVLVYIMSIFAFGCIGGILGMIVALLVNAVLSIAIVLGSQKRA